MGCVVVGNASAESKIIGKYVVGFYVVVVGGDGDGVEGDVVVLNCVVFVLEGVEMIVIDVCWYSMFIVGTFDESLKFYWYGSDVVVDCWFKVLCV